MGDGRSDIERTNAELERIHLAGVERDSEAALELLVEQARLVLYGSLTIAGGALTAAWGQSRPPCLPNLSLGLCLLAVAAGAAWNALIWARTHRLHRVSRKYLSLQTARAAIFGAMSGFNAPEKGELEVTRRAEARAEELVTWVTQAAFGLAAIGTASILTGMVDALGKRGCYLFTVWPLTHFN